MFELLTGLAVSLKTGISGATIGLYGGIKAYTGAVYLLTKPALVYGGMRFTWLMGLATIEWWSGRLYSLNCIGEGVNGFYNHIFQIASPACTGLLTTHISLMGVLVASFMITCIWSIYSFVEYIKKTAPVNGVINEYNDIINMRENRSRNRSRSREKVRSTTPPRKSD